jgi:hypothetical protein
MKALFVGGPLVGQREIGPVLETIVDVADLPRPSSYLLGQVPNVVTSTTVRYTLRRSAAYTVTSRWKLHGGEARWMTAWLRSSVRQVRATGTSSCS